MPHSALTRPRTSFTRGRMQLLSRLLGGLGAALSLGCGPQVSEVRMASYPPKDPDCKLEFVKADMQELSSNQGPWELVGQIVLQQEGKQDPFAEEYRAIVRPRACGMGGDAVAIVLNATSEGLVSSGTAVSYGVLRHRQAEPEEPKTF